LKKRTLAVLFFVRGFPHEKHVVFIELEK